ncbi:MAG: hypothetical protein EXQ82_10445 [Pseudolabrys sp.]|nr:hypothetical protein [Pseudolabrys sp.]
MSAPVWASANVSCRIDDAFLNFELEAIAGRAGPIVQVQTGTITIKPGAAMKLSTPQIAFDHTHIVQQWSLGGDMRLQIEVSDNAAKENVNLVIAALLNEKTDKYAGRYVLTILRAGNSKVLKGRIKECEAG